MLIQNQVSQTQPNTLVQNNNASVTAVASDPLKKLLLSKETQVSHLLNAVLRRAEPGFAEKLISAFYLTIMRDEKLRTSSSDSMVRALYFCAEKAMLPIGGKVWLIPFKGQVTPIIGVQGYRELLRRNPQVIRVGGDIVKQKDDFSYSSGTTPHIHHAPNIFEESAIIGAYAYAEIKGSDHCAIRFCNKQDIDKARAESKSADRENSIWNKHTDEMTRLVPLRKLAKELMVEKESDFSKDDTSNHYSDNVVPFPPSVPELSYEG